MILVLIMGLIIIGPHLKFDRGQLPPKEKALTEKPSVRMVLVLDDLGYTDKGLGSLKDIEVPLTLAVLPGTPYVEKVCSFARNNEMEVIVHLPMEPENSTSALEKETILTNMDDETIRNSVSGMINSVRGARGISNHMGSKATADRRVMKIIMEELKKRNMIFLDSVTTRRSVCREVALETGVPYVKRDIFIDNLKEEDVIHEQLEKAAGIAHSNGKAVVIGHYRPLTIKVLKDAVPGIREEGVEFVRLSEIIRKRE